MVEFELLGVRGGWDQARFGPSDQVEYVLRAGDRTLESYDSVHSFLKLHDLAHLERSTHPRFLGYEVRERSGGVQVGIHGLRFETTYDGLETALRPFLAETFRTLDEESRGDGATHRKQLAESGELLVDVEDLYDQLLQG